MRINNNAAAVDEASFSTVFFQTICFQSNSGADRRQRQRQEDVDHMFLL